MKEFLIEHWSEGFFTVVGGILAWLGLREISRNDEARQQLKVAIDRHEERLDGLEKDRVTRDDFDELRLSMMASFTNMADRFEKKADSMHLENKETLRDSAASIRAIHARVDDLWKYRVGGNPR